MTFANVTSMNREFADAFILFKDFDIQHSLFVFGKNNDRFGASCIPKHLHEGINGGAYERTEPVLHMLFEEPLLVYQSLPHFFADN